MKWVGHIIGMVKKTVTQTFTEKRDHLENLHTYGSIILKYILKWV